MRTKILIAPGLADPKGDSVLNSAPPAWRRLAECSHITRIRALEPQPVSESAWLGVPPHALKIAQGPLTVAALGHDPPERSVHFHLSLLSVDKDETVSEVHLPISESEVNGIFEAASRLSSSNLTPLQGEGVDHALVWEGGSIDLGTKKPSEVAGSIWSKHLPEGDGEPLLRRFIDDSINLLDGLELNRIRQEEGMPKLNLLWPWGQGFREPLPNLALRRGQSVTFYSQSLRLQGLTRLTGYRHADPTGFRRGVHVSPKTIQAWWDDSGTSVILIPGLSEFRRHRREEELEHLLNTWGASFIDSCLSLNLEDEPMELTILVPSEESEGIALQFHSHLRRQNSIPFDERIIGDTTIPLSPVETLIESALQ
ncbi:hypothetical protein QPK87_19805 [Kamptonema cortianum]|nr:hypothetical protein [Geitlerinema splendidum]MDK3158803.1 hypothetical protein [Kamptonema cortianum]